MADLKTSQEASGSPMQGTDLFRIARGNANYKLTSEDIHSQTLTKSQFEFLIAQSKLIPNKTYKVTECGDLGDNTYLITATSNNAYSKEVIWISTYGHVIAYIDTLINNIICKIDSKNNIVLFPELNTAGALSTYNWSNNKIDHSTALVQYDLASQINNCEFSHNSYIECTNTTIVNSVFKNSSINHNVIPTGIVIENCAFNNCVIYLNDTELTVINIKNSTFNDCIIQITGKDIYIDGCKIYGSKYGESYPTYIFDGREQSSVLNNWAGEVHAGSQYGDSTISGYSTIRLNLNIDTEGLIYSDPSIYPTVSYLDGIIVLLENSPVGIYLLNASSLTQATTTMNYIYGSTGSGDFQANHSIVFQILQGTANTKIIEFITYKKSNISDSGQVLVAHGSSVQTGKLKSEADYLVITKRYMTATGYNTWCITEGKHFD